MASVLAFFSKFKERKRPQFVTREKVARQASAIAFRGNFRGECTLFSQYMHIAASVKN